MAWEDKKVLRVWTLNPATYKWEMISDTKGDKPARGSYQVRWYDPEQNVNILYNSKDIYVYRYKQKKEE